MYVYACILYVHYVFVVCLPAGYNYKYTHAETHLFVSNTTIFSKHEVCEVVVMVTRSFYSLCSSNIYVRYVIMRNVWFYD